MVVQHCSLGFYASVKSNIKITSTRTNFICFAFGLDSHRPDIHLNSTKAFAVIPFPTLRPGFSIDYLAKGKVKEDQHWDCSGRGKILLKKLNLNTLLGFGVFISLYKLGPRLRSSDADVTCCFISTLRPLLQLEALGSPRGAALLHFGARGREEKKAATFNSHFSTAINEFSGTWAEQIQ